MNVIRNYASHVDPMKRTHLQCYFVSSSSFGTSRRFMSSKSTYYEDLEIDSDSTSDEIKDAFYQLSKKFHPDKNPDPEAIKRFQAINEAYKTLGNPRLRRKYDTGTLGRMSSVADREISKHTVSTPR